MIGPSNGIPVDEPSQHQHHHQQQLQSQQQNQHSNQHKHQHQELHNPRNSIGAMVPGPRATYSLPRAPGHRHSTGMASSSGPQPQGYYTQDRRNNQRFKNPNHAHSGSQSLLQPQPDFYFMPSQRKYSGEVVRVYVDYGNHKNNK